MDRVIRPVFSRIAICAAFAAVHAAPGVAQTRELPRAPAFRAAQLTELPRAGWVTNGGNLANQRYSPLTRINRGNVASLRAVWRASLGGSGMGPRSANQAQPIVYDGVVYVVTGSNDTFAIDLDSGEVLWEYKANVDFKVARPCCGEAARGLGVGDGKGGVHGAPLTSKLTVADIMTTVSNGRNEMPAFGRAYKPEDLHDVATYIVEQLVK